jgi:hypothetical protein
MSFVAAIVAPAWGQWDARRDDDDAWCLDGGGSGLGTRGGVHMNECGDDWVWDLNQILTSMYLVHITYKEKKLETREYELHCKFRYVENQEW